MQDTGGLTFWADTARQTARSSRGNGRNGAQQHQGPWLLHRESTTLVLMLR